MSEDQTVIYTAQTAQEAHMLRNLLSELGIPAAVDNDMLERGSGVDAVCWMTQARVVVPGQHAEEARRIALELERKGLAASASAADLDEGRPDDEESTTTTILDAWPTCPECGAKRTTRCPICKTTGDDFPPVDMGFIWIPGPVEEKESAESSCGCDRGGSHSGQSDEKCIGSEDNDEFPEHDFPEQGADPPATFICTMCDEPFVPMHASVCVQCGHEFPDGYEAEAPRVPVEHIDSRVVTVVVALALVAAAFVAYFFYLI